MSEDRPKRLFRSRDDRMVAGVLGGISEYLNLDPSLARIVFVIVTVLTGFVPGIFFYVLMAVIVPLQPKAV